MHEDKEIEHLKKGYIESAIALAESFARQSDYEKTSNEAAASVARNHAKRFCKEALDMLQLLASDAERQELGRQVRPLCRRIGVADSKLESAAVA